jgi:shikimate kinase
VGQAVQVDLYRQAIGSLVNLNFADKTLGRLESARAVIALPPFGLMGGFWQVIKKTGGLKIVLTDRPENILSRITFYDIDSNLIDNQLTEKEKKLYLKEIKKDMSYFRKSYHRADCWIDIAGHGVEGSARKVGSFIAEAYAEK